MGRSPARVAGYVSLTGGVAHDPVTGIQVACLVSKATTAAAAVAAMPEHEYETPTPLVREWPEHDACSAKACFTFNIRVLIKCGVHLIDLRTVRHCTVLGCTPIRMCDPLTETCVCMNAFMSAND